MATFNVNPPRFLKINRDGAAAELSLVSTDGTNVAWKARARPDASEVVQIYDPRGTSPLGFNEGGLMMEFARAPVGSATATTSVGINKLKILRGETIQSGALTTANMRPGGLQRITAPTTLPPTATIISEYQLGQNDGFWIEIMARGGDISFDHDAGDAAWQDGNGNVVDFPNGVDNVGGAGASVIPEDNTWRAFIWREDDLLRIQPMGFFKNFSIP